GARSGHCRAARHSADANAGAPAPSPYYFDEWEEELAMIRLGTMLAAAQVMSAVGAMANAKMATQTFTVLAGAGAHDVYPAPDGAVWFTAQSAGKLGRLDPRTGKSDLIALGPDAAPHGVIVGPDGAAGVTEGGPHESTG